MKKEKDYLLLSHFRQNARESLTKISRQTSIPVSTIFDRLKEYEKDVIQKHTSLLDFRSLGYDLKVHLLFRIRKDARDAFQQFLLSHQQVNSVYRVNNGYDFLVEAVFRSMKELDAFFETTGKHGVEERQEYFVLEDLMREAFMTYRPGFERMVLPEMVKNT